MDDNWNIVALFCSIWTLLNQRMCRKQIYEFVHIKSSHWWLTAMAIRIKERWTRKYLQHRSWVQMLQSFMIAIEQKVEKVHARTVHQIKSHLEVLTIAVLFEAMRWRNCRNAEPST